ncbi:hypothetical protein LTR15_008835 [Elasticomyces elasticus]|nr:hypothetical protein LTR15_008835 [Elasticomyces elasticus]
MALNALDSEIVDKLFPAKMVEYVHSGELGRDYENAKKAEEKFGRMRAPQTFVTEDGMSPCEDITEKVIEIGEKHREELQQAASYGGIQPPAASIQTPAASIQTPAASIQTPAASIQTPATPDAGIQTPATPDAGIQPSTTKAAYFKNFHATGGFSNPANRADDDRLSWTEREIRRIMRKAMRRRTLPVGPAK